MRSGERIQAVNAPGLAGVMEGVHVSRCRAG
jgi:hypothetical protein